MRIVLLMAMGALVCGCGSSRSPDEGAPHLLPDSDQAARIVGRVSQFLGDAARAREARPSGYVSDGATLTPRPPSNATLSARFAAAADGIAVLSEERAHLRVAIRLPRAAPVSALVADGYVVYPRALDGADVLFTTRAGAMEDRILFERAPSAPRVEYAVSLDANVAGLRLIENVLELVDANGAPRMRVEQPRFLDADGHETPVSLGVIA